MKPVALANGSAADEAREAAAALSSDPVILCLGELAPTDPEVRQLDLVARYYGYRIATPTSDLTDKTAPGLTVVHAASLRSRDVAAARALLAQARAAGAPLAVVGLTGAETPELMHAIAGDQARVGPTLNAPLALAVPAGSPDQAGYELRGVRLALRAPGAPTLMPAGTGAETMLSLAAGDRQGAALLRCGTGRTAVYLVSRTTDSSTPWRFQRSAIAEVLPLFLLVRAAGGTQCWHPPAAMANFTIDDPWLTEPYGRLSYPGLLQEMRQERFHTTIGFVPWNYDRSEADVVALLRQNPDCFSIAVHGNNHDRYEFFRYAARPGDVQRAKPRELQDFNLRQARERMEAFQRLTGLTYDRVMVFPHGVCPADTFEALKRHGYRATSNFSNVPLDERPPADEAAALRAMNDEWHTFPAVRRLYPQHYTEEAVAIDLFLGNPVMFMAHQDLFFSGIDAFTPSARRVNQRQPAVQWLSLGQIAERLYLLRWPTGHACEVRAFAPRILLQNPTGAAVPCTVRKRESHLAQVRQITLGGQPVEWTAAGGALCCHFTLPAHAQVTWEVHYDFPSPGAAVSIARQGLRNRMLRIIADFRDLTLPRSFVGRVVTNRYYRPGRRRPTLRSVVSRLLGRQPGSPPRR